MHELYINYFTRGSSLLRPSRPPSGPNVEQLRLELQLEEAKIRRMELELQLRQVSNQG
jgi:hypothetical protein